MVIMLEGLPVSRWLQRPIGGACGALSNGTSTLDTKEEVSGLRETYFFRIEAAWAAYEYYLTYVTYTSF